MAGIEAYTDLLGRVITLVPGVEDNLALDALRRIMPEFFSRTGIWREELTVTTEADVASYALTSPAGTKIRQVAEVKNAGADVAIHTSAYWYNRKLSKLTFETHDIPSRTGDALTVTVVIVPERWASAETYPAHLLEDYGEAIAAGAAADLLAMTGKPWTNLDAALFRKKEYRNGLGEAAGQVMRKGTERSLEMRP
ncbi:MAG: hypothetical protein ABFD89_01710 [Bryobacteraceae bacterium]